MIETSKIVGKDYGDFWHCKKRYRVCKGSRGSKKSKTAALNHIVRLIQYPLANILVVRRTGNTLRTSVYSDLLWAIDRLGLNNFFHSTVSPLEITYTPTGQKIYFRGLDDPLKITSISVSKGVLCWVFFEEAYEITKEDDFNKIDLSIRGEMPEGYFKQLTLIFNPWSEQSWLKRRFFDNPDDDTFVKTTTYHANEWLDEADLKVFEKMKITNPRRYRIEGLGEWGIAEGLIYENVVFESFDIEAIRRKDGIKACFGLDFGYTDPNAFVALMVDESEKIIYVFDEWYQNGLTNEKIAEKIKNAGYASQVIYCDSAEPKSIAELNEYGIRAEPSRKGKDSVTHGIQLIQGYKIVVHPNCPNFHHEISNYCWEKDKQTDKPIPKPEHEFSHSMDAMRYAVSKVLIGDIFSWD